MKKNSVTTLLVFLVLGALTLLYFSIPHIAGSRYEAPVIMHTLSERVAENVNEKSLITHKETPEAVRAAYMSSWVAGTPHLRERIVSLIERTELNAVVIDIKDDTGRISFIPTSTILNDIGAPRRRIADMTAFLTELHKKDIYVIGRVAVFQDPYLTEQWPKEAVRTQEGDIWTDRKGLSWIDPGSKRTWSYVVEIAKNSYEAGFDEINFDYVRFPTDGDMSNIVYPHSSGKEKAVVIEEFFTYIHNELAEHPVVTSVDIFGMTTTNRDDLNIGQVLENTLPYFDYIAPMVYPSHYPPQWSGIENPAAKPYAVISKALNPAVSRSLAIGEDPQKIRPWLQDFNLGATYTAEMVQQQIQATYDTGLDSWMLWDPANTYTEEALAPAL